jgi:hypothetical protein
MICCCLPCIISILGVHEDLDLNRGATTEAINTLVAYKFQSKRVHDGDVGEDGGGVLAAGTDKERIISAEDAVSSLPMFLFIYHAAYYIFVVHKFDYWGSADLLHLPVKVLKQ